MSSFPELDDFDSGFTSQPSNTQGSDFFARERELLGDDADQFGAPPPQAQQEDDFGFGDAPAPARSSEEGRFDVSSFEREQPKSNVNITGNDEVSAFEDQYPDIAPQQAQDNYTNGYEAPQQSNYPPTTQSLFPSSGPQKQEEEPEAIRSWREKQSAEIKDRDDKAQARREDTISRAERSIDEFYQEYNAKKEKQIKKNKEEEKRFLDERSDALAKGTVWERVASLVDLNDSRSKTNTKSTKDLARFKELLLALKREGDSAPAAGGY